VDPDRGKFKRTVRGIEIDLGIGQRDLGNYLGLSRENTNRQMNTLIVEGILTCIDGTLVICDMPALQALSNGE